MLDQNQLNHLRNQEIESVRINLQYEYDMKYLELEKKYMMELMNYAEQKTDELQKLRLELELEKLKNSKLQMNFQNEMEMKEEINKMKLKLQETQLLNQINHPQHHPHPFHKGFQKGCHKGGHKGHHHKGHHHHHGHHHKWKHGNEFEFKQRMQEKINRINEKLKNPNLDQNERSRLQRKLERKQHRLNF
eukprot:TRINITY_DN11577_c0_g1_i1.p1 TRINITY_DN11577_c0_g1~~TRINITY_DN11577_c0_g1_i1.p1  ORF type:complete len:190 (-),score=41.01 TRINITY_DN11577_c0_g1_i1:9-578(-)